MGGSSFVAVNPISNPPNSPANNPVRTDAVSLMFKWSNLKTIHTPTIPSAIPMMQEII